MHSSKEHYGEETRPCYNSGGIPPIFSRLPAKRTATTKKEFLVFFLIKYCEGSVSKIALEEKWIIS